MSDSVRFDTEVERILPGPPTGWNYTSLKGLETCPRLSVFGPHPLPGPMDRRGHPE